MPYILFFMSTILYTMLTQFKPCFLLARFCGITFLTETWLTQFYEDKLLLIINYEIIRKNRIKKRGGGDRLVIKKGITFQQLESY